MMMIVNGSHAKYRFSRPHSTPGRGKAVNFAAGLVAQMGEMIEKEDHAVDFNNMLYHDKSRDIRAKTNVSGLRR